MNLLIINGITGALGNALLAQYSREANWVIYGLSRRGASLTDLAPAKQSLPLKHLIASLGPNIADKASCMQFAHAINTLNVEQVVYIHAVGSYLFEIDSQGMFFVDQDTNGDGIDDRVMELTYYAFRHMVEALLSREIKLKAVLFGGIADKYQPTAHHSWWSTMNKTKEYLREKAASSPLGVLLLNLSSVLCAHELATRPYVFSCTDAQPQFWLTPTEVAQQVSQELNVLQIGSLIERDFYRPQPGFNASDYYSDCNFTPRKRLELYGLGPNPT